MTELNQILTGALLMATLSVSFFFLKFWRKTDDSFFACFSLAFCLLAIERMVSLFYRLNSDMQPWAYLLRLAAFVVIIFAIARKNRDNSGSRIS